MSVPAPAAPAGRDGAVPAGGKVLEIEDVTVAYGGVRAVDGCSFAVAEGEITGLIGPNGAGKSTLFNAVSGLVRPDAGRIRFAGHDLSRLRPHQVTRLGVGRTFQVTRVFAELSVLENLVLHAPVTGVRALARRRVHDAERDRAAELLSFVGLAGQAAEPAGTLSYGQRKLLELAMALMAEPRLVLLDEPAGGVNPRLIDDILDRILTLNRRGISFVVVEHNMDVVMELCGSVVVMAHGQVLAHGPPTQVQADDRVLAAYLGQS